MNAGRPLLRYRQGWHLYLGCVPGAGLRLRDEVPSGFFLSGPWSRLLLFLVVVWLKVVGFTTPPRDPQGSKAITKHAHPAPINPRTASTPHRTATARNLERRGRRRYLGSNPAWQDGRMDAQIIWTIVCGLAIAVGAAGIIIPVLPGSILIGISLLVWALVQGSTLGWIIFGVGVIFVAAGMASSAVLTSRVMKERSIPGRSVVIGLILGVVGFFLIPVVGLLVGFILGLFLSEFARQKEFKSAGSSSLAALKAMGLGMLAEFGFASLAAGTWVTGVLIYFVNR